MAGLQSLIRWARDGLIGHPSAPPPAGTSEEPSAWVELRRGAAALEARGGRSQNAGALFAGLAGALAILLIVLSGYAAWNEFPASIDSLHIPAHIKQLYTESAAGAGVPATAVVSSGSSSVQTAGAASAHLGLVLHDFLDGVLVRVLAGAMVLVGIVSGIIRQSIMSFVAGIGGGMMLYTMPGVMAGVLGIPGQDNLDIPKVAIKAPPPLHGMGFKQLQKTLVNVETISSPERSYVLAQAAIIGNLRAAEILMEAASYIRAEGLSFSVPPSYAYAIEKAADGELKTKAAMALAKKHRDRVAAAKSGVRLLAGPATLLAVMAAFFMGIALLMRRRVSRVRQLVRELTGQRQEPVRQGAR